MRKGITIIVFIVVVTIIFISALASINELSRERIIQNARIDRYRSILYAFDIFPANVNERHLDLTATTFDIPWQQDMILKTIDDQIRTIHIPVTEQQLHLLRNSFLSIKDSVEIYARIDEAGEIVAYGFPLKGKGLWGTITAFGVISANFDKMIGIDFIEQVETPGLGARILETEFKYFFRNLDLSGFTEGNARPIILVKQKKVSNVDQSSNSLQAITGATQTVNGVLSMVNSDLKFYIAVLKANQQLLRRLVS